ncbi:hypothetical protein [Sporolactobacillus inulinus]|uniref:hypothetical protein n=1 Tax=Sporolactobacillus inulinus TaxID=2078 RepID=UPI0002E5B828|nr:hypothetical protein [Sporolactobacillus inulinus]
MVIWRNEASFQDTFSDQLSKEGFEQLADQCYGKRQFKPIQDFAKAQLCRLW